MGTAAVAVPAHQCAVACGIPQLVSGRRPSPRALPARHRLRPSEATRGTLRRATAIEPVPPPEVGRVPAHKEEKWQLPTALDSLPGRTSPVHQSTRVCSGARHDPQPRPGSGTSRCRAGGRHRCPPLAASADPHPALPWRDMVQQLRLLVQPRRRLPLQRPVVGAATRWLPDIPPSSSCTTSSATPNGAR
jgi:hypothetical protein